MKSTKDQYLKESNNQKFHEEKLKEERPYLKKSHSHKNLLNLSIQSDEEFEYSNQKISDSSEREILSQKAHFESTKKIQLNRGATKSLSRSSLIYSGGEESSEDEESSDSEGPYPKEESKIGIIISSSSSYSDISAKGRIGGNKIKEVSVESSDSEERSMRQESDEMGDFKKKIEIDLKIEDSLKEITEILSLLQDSNSHHEEEKISQHISPSPHMIKPKISIANIWEDLKATDTDKILQTQEQFQRTTKQSKSLKKLLEESNSETVQEEYNKSVKESNKLEEKVKSQLQELQDLLSKYEMDASFLSMIIKTMISDKNLKSHDLEDCFVRNDKDMQKLRQIILENHCEDDESDSCLSNKEIGKIKKEGNKNFKEQNDSFYKINHLVQNIRERLKEQESKDASSQQKEQTMNESEFNAIKQEKLRLKSKLKDKSSTVRSAKEETEKIKSEFRAFKKTKQKEIKKLSSQIESLMRENENLQNTESLEGPDLHTLARKIQNQKEEILALTARNTEIELELESLESEKTQL